MPCCCFPLPRPSRAAEEYLFSLNRYGWIEIKVSGSNGNVRFVQENKQGDATESFKSALLPAGDGEWKTPEGTIFKISRLKKPVIHDGNREINSGGYSLEVLGEKAAAIREKMPWIAFPDNGSNKVVYGEKTR